MPLSYRTMTSDGEAALDRAAAHSWLTASRLHGYLAAAGGVYELGLELYVWNSRTAAAALVDVGHLEVALRNAYDRVLAAMYSDWAIDGTGAVFNRVQGHPRSHGKQRELKARSRNHVAAAARGLGAAPTHGQVVAALPFGFWSQLTRRERAGASGNPITQRAFPAGVTRAHVHDLVQRVVKFRNRLAHNEPVFSKQHRAARQADRCRAALRPCPPTSVELVGRRELSSREPGAPMPRRWPSALIRGAVRGAK